MDDSWAVLLGWPAVLVALGAAAVGAAFRSAPFLLIAAILVTPMSLYLAGGPRTWWGLLVPFVPVAGAVAVRLRRPRVAWLSVAVLAGVFGWLAVLVARSPRPGPPVRAVPNSTKGRAMDSSW